MGPCSDVKQSPSPKSNYIASGEQRSASMRPPPPPPSPVPRARGRALMALSQPVVSSVGLNHGTNDPLPASITEQHPLPLSPLPASLQPSTEKPELILNSSPLRSPPTACKTPAVRPNGLGSVVRTPFAYPFTTPDPVENRLCNSRCRDTGVLVLCWYCCPSVLSGTYYVLKSGSIKSRETLHLNKQFVCHGQPN